MESPAEEEEVEVAVAQGVVDLVATLVVTLVAILVVTLVATLQGVGEVPQLLLSNQALGLGPIMEEEGPLEDHMEDHMEGAPMVHTPLGLHVLCVADTKISAWICLACLALILVSTFESLDKTCIG